MVGFYRKDSMLVILHQIQVVFSASIYALDLNEAGASEKATLNLSLFAQMKTVNESVVIFRKVLLLLLRMNRVWLVFIGRTACW